MNVSVHETSLTMPRFTKVSVPSQEFNLMTGKCKCRMLYKAYYVLKSNDEYYYYYYTLL
jgi:hypothetical protein